MENTQEMFILSKYKYIRQFIKSSGKVLKNELTSKVTNLTPNITVTIPSKNCTTSEQNGIVKELENKKSTEKSAEQEAKDKRKADKLAKQEMMKKACQPSKKKEEKVKFVEKIKYVNETPHGEKKGIFYIKLIRYV